MGRRHRINAYLWRENMDFLRKCAEYDKESINTLLNQLISALRETGTTSILAEAISIRTEK